MDNPKELIGVLQAISIVAKKLVEKLMRIEKEVNEYESNHPSKNASENQER